MKQTILIILTFFLLSWLNKSNDTKHIIKTTYHYTNSIKDTVIYDTISYSEPLTLDFYKKHYYTPYYYPNNFVNNKFSDTTINMFATKELENNIKTSVIHSYTYDSLSRVTEYNYTDCIVCAQAPHNMTIKYDTLNRPILFINGFGGDYNEILLDSLDIHPSGEISSLIMISYKGDDISKIEQFMKSKTITIEKIK